MDYDMDQNNHSRTSNHISAPPLYFLKKYWDRATDPHALIQERDQRRLARLLSALLLGFIALAILLEVVTVSLITWEEEYTGYQQTIGIVILLMLTYGLSRTRHVRLAAGLTLIVSSVGLFITAIAEPSGILGGLLDYLIIPVWFGSLFFYRRQLIYVVLFQLIGLLLIPLMVPEVS